MWGSAKSCELRVRCAEIKAMILTAKTKKQERSGFVGAKRLRSHLNLACWWSRAGLQSVSMCEKPELSMFISHPSAAQHNLQPPTVDRTQPLFPPLPSAATAAAARRFGFSGQLLKMKIRVGGVSIGQRRWGLFLPPVIPLMLTIKWGHHPDTWGIS